jgi:hypothetical protein
MSPEENTKMKSRFGAGVLGFLFKVEPESYFYGIE